MRNMGDKKISIRALKKLAAQSLAKDDFEEAMSELREIPARKIVNPLIGLLCSKEELIRWRAGAALGVIVSELAESEAESAREIMRRLMWQMNEESGGIGWGVPEAMSQIMARNKKFALEYAKIIISYMTEGHNFLEHDALRRGAVWGVGVIAESFPEIAQQAVDALEASLDWDDPYIQGYAAWALGCTGASGEIDKLKALSRDNREIDFFQDNQLRRISVGALASQAIESLEKAGA